MAEQNNENQLRRVSDAFAEHVSHQKTRSAKNEPYNTGYVD